MIFCLGDGKLLGADDGWPEDITPVFIFGDPDVPEDGESILASRGLGPVSFETRRRFAC